MRYGISYGNGNDGVSHLYPRLTVDAPEGSEYMLARAAMLSGGSASRAFLRAHTHVDEMGENGAQACVYDPPRSPGWSDHNGAWRLVEVFPADDEASERSTAPHYDSPAAAFGRQLVKACAAA